MANSVEDIYQQIAGYIVESIDDDWSVAWVCVEIEEDDNGLTYDRYRTADTDGDLSFKAGHEVYELFDALRRMLKRPSEKPWRFAKFTPEPSGKFHIDFEYEPPFTLSANLDQSEAGRVSNDRGLETTPGELRSLPCPTPRGADRPIGRVVSAHVLDSKQLWTRKAQCKAGRRLTQTIRRARSRKKRGRLPHRMAELTASFGCCSLNGRSAIGLTRETTSHCDAADTPPARAPNFR